MPGYDLKLERSETPAEHDARIRTESRRALITDFMWVALSIFLLVLTGLFLWVLLFKTDASNEQKELAQKVLFSLIAGVIAFVLGRASGK